MNHSFIDEPPMFPPRPTFLAPPILQFTQQYGGTYPIYPPLPDNQDHGYRVSTMLTAANTQNGLIAMALQCATLYGIIATTPLSMAATQTAKQDLVAFSQILRNASDNNDRYLGILHENDRRYLRSVQQLRQEPQNPSHAPVFDTSVPPPPFGPNNTSTIPSLMDLPLPKPPHMPGKPSLFGSRR